MRAFYYDLHIHSCLSPCADEDMTPNNIVNMAVVAGLELIALTDHNSCLNCPAFMELAERAGILAFPGMELTTSEEIHVVCLFPKLDNAMRFGEYVRGRLPYIKNDAGIFGSQTIMNANDVITGREDALLITASEIGIDETPALVRKFGGICFPAHIDRESFSILSVLGAIPDEYGFRALEVSDPARFFSGGANAGLGGRYTIVTSSDAHTLPQIGLRERRLHFDTPDFAGLAARLGPRRV